MKNPGFPEKLAAGGRLGRRALLILLLLVLAFRPGLAADSATSPYDSLRLFSEALFEIAQKYVYEKPNKEIIYGSIRGMMNSLDPDSAFLTPEEYQSYSRGRNEATAEAGVDCIIKDNLLTLTAVVDGGPGAAAGLEPGDHVLKINDQTLRNLTTQEAASRLRGAPGTNVKLEVLRSGALKPLKITVILQPLGDNTVTSKIINDSYGYVRLRYFNDATPKELALALESLQKQGQPLRGLVLDLRNNARGSLEQAVRTASLFLGDKEVVTAKGRTAGSQETFRGQERNSSGRPRTHAHHSLSGSRDRTGGGNPGRRLARQIPGHLTGSQDPGTVRPHQGHTPPGRLRPGDDHRRMLHPRWPEDRKRRPGTEDPGPDCQV